MASPTPESIRDEIEQLAAVLAMLLTPGAAAVILKKIAAEIAGLHPKSN
jgi:hypothetical protein